MVYVMLLWLWIVTDWLRRAAWEGLIVVVVAVGAAAARREVFVKTRNC